ncbi:ABC transporter ATP-binding protein [Haloarcula mannanilytica]|uniref:ABC transporter ATP-binding protein n=1 Tax=Haloarcula mannanilytica TaxID=2509225 RepID=A0A4C2ED85_9EURY|nr:ABC transporter ATP-binding protein [Haloarcula mannanilytica]GCF12446.1 ABC transporter ATP-binding protein [Haloarcula mannanilytica]
MLEARNLRKSFGELVATDDITLEFGKDEGELVFIVGPNGAGKTTFINLLTGFLSPDEGEIVLDGEDITGMSADSRVDAGIARSFQVVKVFEEMTVRENLRTVVLTEQGKTWSLFSMADGHEDVETKVEELLARFRLEDAADTIAEELPHGDRKLLDVAMSFGLDPEYLLLDEPTSGVSTREKEYVIETIVEVGRAEGVTTVTIEHDMDIVTEYADRVVALHQGAVHGVGPPTMLETDDELRRLLLGVGDDE